MSFFFAYEKVLERINIISMFLNRNMINRSWSSRLLKGNSKGNLNISDRGFKCMIAYSPKKEPKVKKIKMSCFQLIDRSIKDGYYEFETNFVLLTKWKICGLHGFGRQ